MTRRHLDHTTTRPRARMTACSALRPVFVALIACFAVLPAPAQSAEGTAKPVFGAAPEKGFCAPSWAAAFGPEAGIGWKNGSLGSVHCSAVWDDGLGDGEVLYIGGRFDSILGQPTGNIARYDGTAWSALPGPNAYVTAMTVHDDGSGPALFVGGTFSMAGGVSAARVAKFDGTTWTPLAGGAGNVVHALQSFPVSPGVNHLAVGGIFTTADGSSHDRVAAWDGSAFYALGDGFNSHCYALALHPPTGPTARLYAGGLFNTSGATSIDRLARYEPGSSSWVEVDGGVAGSVNELESRLLDGTQSLFVAGSFTSAGTGGGTVAADDIASWTDSGGWTGYPAFTFSTDLHTIEVHDSGFGDQLHVGGGNLDVGTGKVYSARFDGAAWQPLGEGTSSIVYELISYDDGTDNSLWVGGQYFEAGNKAATSICEWDGSDWIPIAEGLAGYTIKAITESSITGLPTIYLGGQFRTPTHTDSSGMAGYRNGLWYDIGEISGTVWDIVEFDDGSGPALYVGGYLFDIDGVPFVGIARWDGTSWSDVGGDVDSRVRALTVHDDGSGPALYAGGQFDNAGGSPAGGIAKWDGTTWSQVGGGLGTSWVEDLISWDDGSGQKLYAAGSMGPSFGTTHQGVAYWDGVNWNSLGGGVDVGSGRALEVWDDGSGEKLYLGGGFNTVDGVPSTSEIAAWDGASWSALDNGLSQTVECLEVFDDGTGEKLFAGGQFGATGDFSALVSHVASWDGADWAPVGGGVNHVVETLSAVDDGSGAGERLGVGGQFNVVNDLVGGAGGSYAAFWGHCGTENNWIDIGFPLAGTYGAPLLVGNGSLAYGSLNTVNLSNALEFATAGLFMGFDFGPTPFAGGILVPVPFLDPVILDTSSTGTIPNSFVMPIGVPPGITIHVQWVIADPSGVSGYALSNCVVGTTP